MPTNRRIFSQDAAAVAAADSAEGLVLHLDANDEDSIESGGANTGNGSGTWFDIANHDLNVPLVDKASNLQLHLNASDTTSYSGSGGTWTDISGNTSNDGIIDGATFASDTRGYFTFDGSDDDIEIAANSNLVLGTVKTFEFWINIHAVGDNIFVRSNAGYSDYAYNFHTASSSGDKFGLAVYNSGGSTILLDRSVAITLNTFHHIVVTFEDRTSGSAYKIYKDGTLASSGTLSGDADNDTSFLNYIGSQGGTSGFLDGDISVIRCYDVVLTPSEVAQNFRANSFLSYDSPYTTNLQANLDAGDTTTLTASTWSDKANSNNGTFNNFSSTLSDFYDKELGNWIDFDGSNDYLQIPASTNLDIGSGGFTYETWLLNEKSSGASSVISNTFNVSGYTGYTLRINNGTDVQIFIYNNEAIIFDQTASSSVTTNTWTHLAFTVASASSGAAVKLYINGILSSVSGTLSGAYGGSGQNIQAGQYPFAPSGRYFNGKMGVLKFHSEELTASEVAQNYLATKNDYPNDNNFTNSGATFTASSTPYYFDFNGSSDLMTRTLSNFSYRLDDVYTVIQWLRADSVGSTEITFNTYGSSNGAQFVFKSGPILEWFHSGTSTLQMSKSVSATTWYMAAVTFDGTNGKLYLSTTSSFDSSPATDTGSGLSNGDDTNISIGGRSPYFFNGRIAATRVYHKALSASELTAIWTAEKDTF